MENETNNEIKYCPYCISPNKTSNKFCYNCGTSFDNPTEQDDYEEHNKKNNTLKDLGFLGIVGIIVLFPYLFVRLFFAIGILIVVLYISVPKSRKIIHILLKIIGALFLILIIYLLIMLGACIITYS